MLNSKGPHLIFMSGGFELYLEWQVNCPGSQTKCNSKFPRPSRTKQIAYLLRSLILPAAMM